MHTIDLSNRVLQCCMLIAMGDVETALRVAQTLSVQLSDWIASVMEVGVCVSVCV